MSDDQNQPPEDQTSEQPEEHTTATSDGRNSYGFREGIPESDGDGEFHLAESHPEIIEQTPEQFREAVNPSRIPDPETAD